jgi:hypothetical protein
VAFTVLKAPKATANEPVVPIVLKSPTAVAPVARARCYLAAAADCGAEAAGGDHIARCDAAAANGGGRATCRLRPAAHRSRVDVGCQRPVAIGGSVVSGGVGGVAAFDRVRGDIAAALDSHLLSGGGVGRDPDCDRAGGGERDSSLQSCHETVPPENAAWKRFAAFK